YRLRRPTSARAPRVQAVTATGRGSPQARCGLSIRKRPARAPAFQTGCPEGLDLQIAGRGLPAALVALELVGDLLAFVERLQAGAFNRRDVHEDVRAAVIRLDEAV